MSNINNNLINLAFGIEKPTLTDDKSCGCGGNGCGCRSNTTDQNGCGCGKNECDCK